MKKSYIAPRVDVFSATVEKGYQCSGGSTTLLCGSEGMSDNAYIGFGSSGNNGGGNMEGIGDNGAIFF